MVSSYLKMAPRCANIGQHSSNMAPTWPNMVQLGPNLAQLGSQILDFWWILKVMLAPKIDKKSILTGSAEKSDFLILA